MEQDKIGISDLCVCIELAAKNIILGIEIGKDGVNASDIIHVPKLVENIKELVEFIASKPELGKEIKDLDPMEGIALIQKAYSAYKEIKEEA